MNGIVILGGGGHAKVLIELVRACGKYDIVGILDPGLPKGSTVLDVTVSGGDELLDVLFKEGVRMACIGMGAVKDNSVRKNLYAEVRNLGFETPTLAHPGSIIARSVKLGEGVQVMAGAVIQADTSIGENTIVNTGAIVDHDCAIGRHVHICPGAVVSGGVSIGDDTFVGAGATVINGIRIGGGAVIGAGSVVIDDLPQGARVVGVPAR